MGKFVSSITDALGLTDVGGADAERKRMAEAQAAAARAQEEGRVAAANMEKNFAADLKQENLTQVVAGGTAAALDTASDLKKKRKPSAPLSSQLGIM